MGDKKTSIIQTMGKTPVNCPEQPKYHYRGMAGLPFQKELSTDKKVVSNHYI